ASPSPVILMVTFSHHAALGNGVLALATTGRAARVSGMNQRSTTSNSFAPRSGSLIAATTCLAKRAKAVRFPDVCRRVVQPLRLQRRAAVPARWVERPGA